MLIKTSRIRTVLWYGTFVLHSELSFRVQNFGSWLVSFFPDKPSKCLYCHIPVPVCLTIQIRRNIKISCFLLTWNSNFDCFLQCCGSAPFWCRSGSDFPSWCWSWSGSGSHCKVYTCSTVWNFFAFINSNVSLNCFLFLVSVIGVKFFGISDSLLKFFGKK